MSLTPELKNHFLHLYHMALSDSQVDIKELEMLYRIGESKGISRADIDALILHSDQAQFTAPATVLEKIDCLYDLCLIAWSDGQVDAVEKETLTSLCVRFGFQDENIAIICDYLLEEAYKHTPKEQILSTVSENL